MATASPTLEMTTTAPSADRPRYVALDAARVLAALAIVWIHTPRSAELIGTTIWARFAVPFFTASAMLFVVDVVARYPRRTLGEYAVSRFLRIYVPFLAWSVVYLLFKLAKQRTMPEQPNDFPGIEALWLGSFYHLWFMPFILVASLGAFALVKCWPATQRARGILATGMIVAGLIIAVVQPWDMSDASLRALVWQTLPAACWGLALGLTRARWPSAGPSRALVTWLSMTLFLAAQASLAGVGRDALWENIAGCVLCVAALAPAPPAWMRWAARYGALAYGVYLSHLLVIKMAESLATKAQLNTTPALDVAVFVVAAAGSFGIAALLSRSRFTRWLVG